MKESKVYSYTAASAFPVKLLQGKGVLDNEGKIRPRHLQLSITNRCNLNCSFCSCSERNKSEEMPFALIDTIAKTYKSLGCEAVTITGGGEPLLHPNINEAVTLFASLGTKIGLVTNGLLLDRLSDKRLVDLSWLRVSFDDNRDFEELKEVLWTCPRDTTDWAFSYVVSRHPNIRQIANVVEFANKYNFTHVRVVSDLLDIDHVPDMMEIKNKVSAIVDDSLVIYQGRKNYTLGSKECYISLLKPVVNTDGQIYPCCGAQYALDNTTRAYNGKMVMGGVENIFSISRKQSCFDGSKCKKCYYSEYNEMLGIMKLNVSHKEFV